MPRAIPYIGRTLAHLALAACLAGELVRSLGTELIALWTFNSSDDGEVETGSLDPELGSGEARSAGGVNQSFGTVAGGATSDSPGPNNSQVRLARFPARAAANKSAGLEFQVDTTGFEGIRIAWDQYNSGSASRFWRIQYSADGQQWIDHAMVTNATPSAWRLRQSVSFEGIEAANNNSHFGFRFVAEFESTATGQGAEEYVPVSATANYSTAGTLWLDMLRVEGYRYIPNNQPPTITSLPQILVQMNSPTGPIEFLIDDPETPPSQLELSYSASPPELVSRVEFGGAEARRTAVVWPALDALGHCQVSIRVTDQGGKFRETSFLLAILPDNNPPRISRLADQQVYRNQWLGPIAFTVEDAETAPEFLRVTAHSSDARLIPVEDLSLTRDGKNWALSLKPASFEVGTATITIAAHDGALERSVSFDVAVLPERYIAEWNFNSLEPDAESATGSAEPYRGTGTAAALGGVSETFGSVAAGANSDAESPDNSMWRLARFPPQGESDRTAGAVFMASTVGYSNICVLWDHYNSATASRYWRVQVTTDGETFVDAAAFTNTQAGAWHVRRGASFKGIPDVDHNPRFGVRLVSSFAPTEGSLAPGAYETVEASASYSGGGTLWLDAVRLAGEPMAVANQAPIIAEIPGIRVILGAPIPPVPLAVSDDRTPPGSLELACESSNPALLAAEDIAFETVEGVRWLRLSPKPGHTGTAAVTVTASDGTLTAWIRFNVTVTTVALTAIPGAQTLSLSWESAAEGYVLQQSTDLIEWHSVPGWAESVRVTTEWTVPFEATRKFFRLTREPR